LNKKIRYHLDQSSQSEGDKILYVASLLQTVKLKHEEIEIRNRDLEKLKNLFNIADLIYSTYSEVKKLKIQEIHNDIQKDIDRFYSFIHKDEEHNDIKLIIDLKKKGSTNIKVNSYDNYIDPRAFQSEGHLDSLGLCIFLAFVKKFNISSNLIILDDIVTTIDSQHRMKICELIYENFSDKQLIITTHDNVWFELPCCATHHS
jgi:recombinational DNA repair ATPase RecF